MKSVASWCAIELTHPRVIEGAHWDQSFENSYYLLDVQPIGFTGGLIHRWKLVDWGNYHDIMIDINGRSLRLLEGHTPNHPLKDYLR